MGCEHRWRLLRRMPALLVLGACSATGPGPDPAGGVASSVDSRLAQPCLERGLPAIAAQSERLGLLRPAPQEYRLLRAAQPADRLTCTFQQVNRGVPVQFQEYAVHLSPDGRVVLSSGRYSATAAAQSPQPQVSEITVIEQAHRDARRLLATEQPRVAPPRLVFTATGADGYRLDFETTVSREDGTAVRLLYDAANGRGSGQQRLAQPQTATLSR